MILGRPVRSPAVNHFITCDICSTPSTLSSHSCRGWVDVWAVAVASSISSTGLGGLVLFAGLVLTVPADEEEEELLARLAAKRLVLVAMSRREKWRWPEHPGWSP